MKKYIVLIILPLLLFSCSKTKFSDKGLLIIAHGSKNTEWNNKIISLEAELKKIFSLTEEYKGIPVKACFLECTPFIEESVKALRDQGAKKILALPVFIVPSGHLCRDIPAVLGTYHDKRTTEELKAEGIKIISNNTGICMGPPLSYGSLIEEITVSRIKEMSQKPEDEAAVILLHGSAEFKSLWQELAQRSIKAIKEKTGIKNCSYAFTGAGQYFKKNALPEIDKALKTNKRVLVYGIFTGKSAKKMAESQLAKSDFSVKKHFLNNSRVQYSDNALLPDQRITAWIKGRFTEYASQN